MNHKIVPSFVCLFISLFSFQVYAIDPVLRFSDLINGPDIGLGDGLGSGVIVTVWGQHLGDSQSDSTITFIDSNGDDQGPVHVYYWKKADGQSPGGPSNLYASHKMQEIAFSIPDSALGLGQIKVTVKGASSTLPFTVRDGNIYHVMSTGADNGDGSFAAPWLTLEYAIKNINVPGGTIYVYNVDSGCDNCERGVIWDNNKASSTQDAQFGFVAYPGFQPKSTGGRGFSNFTVDGQVISKFDVYASNNTSVDANGQPSGQWTSVSYCIETDRFGRVIGNRCTDIPGQCASAFQAGITGNALNGNEVDNAQILGNEIYEYGCEGGARHQHTTYMSVRSGLANLQVIPWRYGWNYLHDNHTKNGIHQFDENLTGLECGSPNGLVVINDNVVINQAGAGISIAANCPWTNDFEVYNNILINTGRAVSWDGIDPIATNKGANTAAISIFDGDGGDVPNDGDTGGLLGTVRVHNNTIIGWNDDDLNNDARACLGMKGTGDHVSVIWDNNICVTEKDKAFVAPGCCGAEVMLDNVTGSNNVWHYGSVATASKAIPPTWDFNLRGDPLITQKLSILSLRIGSSAVGGSSNKNLTYDIYGIPRAANLEIGAVGFVNLPNPPTGIGIQ